MFRNRNMHIDRSPIFTTSKKRLSLTLVDTSTAIPSPPGSTYHALYSVVANAGKVVTHVRYDTTRSSIDPSSCSSRVPDSRHYSTTPSQASRWGLANTSFHHYCGHGAGQQPWGRCTVSPCGWCDRRRHRCRFDVSAPAAVFEKRQIWQPRSAGSGSHAMVKV